MKYEKYVKLTAPQGRVIPYKGWFCRILIVPESEKEIVDIDEKLVDKSKIRPFIVR